MFKEALVVTRGLMDVTQMTYILSKRQILTLIEDWGSLEQYEVYLQFREDGGIAELLDPILADGWEGVKASIKRLGNITDI